MRRISRESIQKLDLFLLILETIDLNGIQSIYSLSNKLNLNETFPSKVIIWKVRNSNPMRKSFNNKNIKINEFDALIRLTAEMSKYLYPFIRKILKSREDFEKSPLIWNDFKTRFMELINERFNVDSMKVKKLLDPNLNDVILTKSLLTLAFCISNDGYEKLKASLVDN